MRIMLVDDDLEILEVLHGIVSQFLGYECLAVSSVAEAMKNLNKFNPQLIITDHNMPYESGSDLIRQVKARSPHIAVIVLSANRQIGVAVETMRLGADDFVSKPADIEEIESAIKRVKTKWENFSTSAEMEQQHIENVLAHCGSVAKAAEKLGMNASTIWRKRKAKTNRAA